MNPAMPRVFAKAGTPDAQQAESILFADALACEEVLPVEFVPGDATEREDQRTVAAAEALLRSLGLAEDSRTEDTDDRSSADLALARLEAKVDLLTGLVQALLSRDAARRPIQGLRWSRLGACVPHPAALTVGQTGLLCLQPADWLPEVLRLPARIIACEQGIEPHWQLWLRFTPLPASLEQALERHLFRTHRLQVAEARRLRDGNVTP